MATRKKKNEVVKKKALTPLERQLKKLDPSIPMALYLHLMNREDLAYLREDDQSIHGFLVDLSVDQVLSGFLFLSIQQQLLYAYLSLDSKLLILFPSIDIVKDFRYGFSDLQGSDVLITSEDFESYSVCDSGSLNVLIDPYVPPHSKRSSSAEDVETEFAQLATSESDSSSTVSSESLTTDPSMTPIPSDIPSDFEDDVPVDLSDIDMGGAEDFYDDYETPYDDLAVDELSAVSSVVSSFEPSKSTKRLLDVFVEQTFETRSALISYMIKTLLIRSEAVTAVVSNLTKLALTNGITDEAGLTHFLKTSLCKLLAEQGDAIGFVNKEVTD